MSEINRRNLAKGAAWTVPALTLLGAAPARAASLEACSTIACSLPQDPPPSGTNYGNKATGKVDVVNLGSCPVSLSFSMTMSIEYGTPGSNTSIWLLKSDHSWGWGGPEAWANYNDPMTTDAPLDTLAPGASLQGVTWEMWDRLDYSSEYPDPKITGRRAVLTFTAVGSDGTTSTCVSTIYRP